MLHRILIAIVILSQAGCITTPPTTAVQTPVKPKHPQVDPEMAELLSLLRRTGSPAGRPAMSGVTNARQHTFQTIGADTDPCVSRNGQVMVYASTAHSEKPDIFIKAVNGRTMTQLTTDPARDIQPSVSPGGNYVAFASDRSGAWEVYVTGIDGRVTQQLTRGGGHSLHPSWSPKGDKIVYCRQNSRSGQWELWIVSLSAPANQQFVGYGLFPAWSPAEDLIAYQLPRGRAGKLFGIWTIRLIDGEPTPQTLVASSATAGYVNPTFSTDGKRIAFTSASVGGPEMSTDIYTVGVNGDRMERLTKGPGKKYGPLWMDNRIFFSCNRDNQENIWSVQTGTGGADADDGAKP